MLSWYRIPIVMIMALLMWPTAAMPAGTDDVAAGTPAEVVALPALLEEARAHNPGLKAAQAQWEAAQLRIPQAAALPDPMFGYMFMGEMLETRLGPQEQVIEAEQMIPFPGKLWQKRRMAMAEAKAARAQLDGAERDLILHVSQAYYDLYAVDATLQAVEELRGILKKFEAIAQARYASQGGGQRDVAKAQAEVSDTLQRLFVLRQQRETVTALLNAQLDRDPMTPIGRTATPEIPALSLTYQELLDLAKIYRPELREASAQLNRSRHARTLAKLDYVPDVSIGFQYNQIGAGMTTDPDDGRDAWMIPLKITLPLWQNRLGPAVSEAKRNVQAGEAQVTQAENMTEYDVKDAYYRFTAAKQVVEVYQNALIPEAELAFQSDQAGYEAGRVDILNLIDSERVYLNAKIAYHQALADTLKNYAALERAVGTSLVESDK